ncbi:hypothetical protein HYV88_00080 [Candidatus Woesearchaeota archaeon]|nr:hypothetical protein [Candidatus Woesearchaeota archaeon]
MDTSKIILVVISIIFILSLFSSVGKRTNNDSETISVYAGGGDAGGCWKAPAGPFVRYDACFDANVVSYQTCVGCCGDREGCKQGCWNKRIGADHVCFIRLR